MMSPIDALVRVTEVKHLGARQLRVVFSDGLAREIDFAGALPRVLSTIDDDDAFSQVTQTRHGLVSRRSYRRSLQPGVGSTISVTNGDSEKAAGFPIERVTSERMTMCG